MTHIELVSLAGEMEQRLRHDAGDVVVSLEPTLAQIPVDALQ
ncbi:MAG TPA: hypothetical protein VLV78_15260 [Thermoanaerobaculia bacterium]|nr:hypothetical protein [Thermoanaerobaculia bacterium]